MKNDSGRRTRRGARAEGRDGIVKTVVLTGATSGIGRAAANKFALESDNLILQGPESPAEVLGDFDAIRGRASIHYIQADYASLNTVEEMAAEILSLTGAVDLLINNAGIPGSFQRRTTSIGVERTFHINFLAGTLLTNLLLPLIPERTGRILNVSSATHFSATLDLDVGFLTGGYSATNAYARSKLAVTTYSCWLARQIEPVVLSLHPGVISTGLLHSMFGIGGSRAELGASTCWLPPRSQPTVVATSMSCVRCRLLERRPMPPRSSAYMISPRISSAGKSARSLPHHRRITLSHRSTTREITYRRMVLPQRSTAQRAKMPPRSDSHTCAVQTVQRWDMRQWL